MPFRLQAVTLAQRVLGRSGVSRALPYHIHWTLAV